MTRFITILAALAMPLATMAAQVIDGDTLVIDDLTYRIEGIDAPELGQTCGTAQTKRWKCGAAAKDYLSQLVATRAVTCDALGTDGYDRIIARCSVRGQDIGAQMVLTGNAWAFRKYSQTYVDEEKAASIAQLGIWAAPSVPAWDYRAAKWEVSAQVAPNGCPIKGNISSNGKIYHPPWSPWYTRTRIRTDKGERWFCSEDEAIAAGWRAPRW